jgi:hypothetical protein
MKISQSTPAVKKLLTSHQHSKSRDVNVLLKKISDSKIVGIIKTLLKSSHANDSHAWEFAGIAFNELAIRVWGKKHRKSLESFRQAIMNHSDTCLSRRSYALETAGILDKKSKKIFHPYPYSDVAEKVVEKWYRSSTDKSLQEYISAYMKKHVTSLKRNSVKYLTPNSQQNFRVTFKNGQPRIGKARPKNGTYIFALGKDGNKNILLAGIKRKGSFQHSSFFAGAPVASVGKFTIKNKKITQVLLSSGHYHPKKEHGKALLKYLRHHDNLGSKAAYIKVVTHKP